MARKTLIFGNGLVMALDPAFFLLDRAIGKVWDTTGLLDIPSKQLICNCLPVDTDDRPHGEDDLDVLQLALSACELLSRIAESRVHWLSSEGKAFPIAVRQFIYHTAIQFHNHAAGLPAEFVDCLATFIHGTKSHVATLNYDNLLYQPLIDREVLKGYDGALVDGFYSTGFDPDHLERKFGKAFGYYLHLHGSPLFVDREGTAFKLPQGETADDDGTLSSHIVLTHFKHKPTVINTSALLTTYWHTLIEAMNESDEILLVGYSGADEHLNDVLRGFEKIKIRVVEWSGEGGATDRVNYWRKKLLSTNVSLVQCNSLLDFRNWAGE